MLEINTTVSDYRGLKILILDMQENLVLEALRRADGNKTAAARMLGMGRRTFQRFYNRWASVQDQEALDAFWRNLGDKEHD